MLKQTKVKEIPNNKINNNNNNNNGHEVYIINSHFYYESFIAVVQ